MNEWMNDTHLLYVPNKVYIPEKIPTKKKKIINTEGI